MGYSEFPHTNYDSDDMRHFIKVYKDLVGKYEGTLNKITDLTKRLDNYEKNMDAYLYELRNTYVPNAVKDALAKEMVKYNNELSNIKQNIANLTLTIEQLSNKCDQRYAEIKVNIERLNEKIAMEVIKLHNKISEMYDKLNANIQQASKEINNRIDREHAEMIVRDLNTLDESKEYTDSKISDIMNIINGIKVEIDKASLKWLWDYGCNFGGYTAKQWYEDVTITAKDWHDTPFTCVDWYVRGREVFNWWDRRRMMFSPVTGKWVDVREAIYEIANILKPAGIAAQEYEDLQITAQQYEELRITGFDYDWNGKEKLKNVLEGN